MDFFDVVDMRRSVRKFLPDMVKREDVLKILSCADKAPSALNSRPWEFLVVSGEKKAALGASYGRVTRERLSAIPAKPGTPHSSPDFLQFADSYGGAPLVIAVLMKTPEDPAYRKAYLESASAAMQNIMLAATALGLGTCWMTGPLRDEAGVRKTLGVPEDREIVAFSPLGYPALLPQPRPVRDVSPFVRWIE